MKIGYARVSTTDQNLTYQLKELKAAGCELIFKEKITGTHADRPELIRMLEHLRKGDKVIVCKLDRLARSVKDLLDIVAQIGERGASFRSLSESWADTTTPQGKMIMTIFAGIAEFERSLIIERTSSGRKLAKERGVRFGRPDKIGNSKIEYIKYQLEKEGKSIQEIANTENVHRATIYRLLKKNE